MSRNQAWRESDLVTIVFGSREERSSCKENEVSSFEIIWENKSLSHFYYDFISWHLYRICTEFVPWAYRTFQIKSCLSFNFLPLRECAKFCSHLDWKSHNKRTKWKIFEFTNSWTKSSRYLPFNCLEYRIVEDSNHRQREQIHYNEVSNL